MDKILSALLAIERLKCVERGNGVKGRQESSAEHTHNCMLVADILIDHVEEDLDRYRVLELLLYHDLVEVYAGDAKYVDEEQMAKKDALEHKAYEKLLTVLPNAKRYKDIYHEYELRESREAIFAKAIDCLESMINSINEDRIPKDSGFTEEAMRNRYKKWVSEFRITNDLFEKCMNLLQEQGKV